jgi:hypothetical protein
MAKNNGKKQLKFNTSLQETMEEEGMNRRLKGTPFEVKIIQSINCPDFMCF